MKLRLLLLGLVMLAPVAVADHAFSHRVYVVGRVIDANGQPAAGLAVNVTFEGFAPNGLCYDSKEEITGSRGDYEVCRHAHAIPPDAAATVRVLDASRRVPVDPDLRHAVASFQLDRAAPARDIAGERHFARTFHVTGRSFVMLPDPVREEGVAVNATPLAENVSVELRAGEVVLASGSDVPDEFGRFLLDLDVAELPAGALVRVRAGPDLVEEVASAAFRRADVSVARDLRLVRGPGEDAPGSETPMPAWLALTAALSCAAAWRATRGRRSG